MLSSNPLDLSGKTVLVTGASSGIGRETAIYLSKLGANLVVTGRDRARLDAVQAKIGASCMSEAFDLAAIDEIPSWLKQIANRTGPIAGLVHSAGISATRPLRTISEKEIVALMTINVSSAIALAKGFRQKGVYADGASIVLLASVMGLVGQPANSLYSASKGALIAAARSLALELARENIRVNCIAPAMVMTEMGEHLKATLPPENWKAVEAMHPLGVGTPEDVAGAAAFLIAPTGRWITGTTLVMDGGYTAS